SIFNSIFFFSSRRRHTIFSRDWSSDVCSSDLVAQLIHRIRDGELDTRIDIKAPGELGELRDSINEMTAALRDAQAELQQNVDQATEDLRETLETIEIQNSVLDIARMEALEASQVKSMCLANLIPEFRTPLLGIIG